MSSGSDVDPTVYVEGLAGDVVAVLDQEAHRAGYLVRLAEAAERDRLQNLLLLVLGDASDHVRLYEPRADRVHRYAVARSEEHTSELQSRQYLVCRLLLE